MCGFYFNITKAEAMEMEFSVEGGLTAMIDKITAAKDFTSLVSLFKEFILMAYGEKSADGKRFIKSDELSEAFSQTNAYSELFMELATDDEAASVFINGIVPDELKQDENNISVVSPANGN